MLARIPAVLLPGTSVQGKQPEPRPPALITKGAGTIEFSGGELKPLTTRTAWEYQAKHSNAKRESGPLLKLRGRIDENPLHVKQLGWLQTSPDGSNRIFSTLGEIRVTSHVGAPRRLTNAKDRKFEPGIQSPRRSRTPAAGDASYISHLRSPHSNITRSGHGKRLFYDEVNQTAPGRDTPHINPLVLIRTYGIDKRVHVRFSNMVAALPEGTTEPVTLNPDTPIIPVNQVTTGGADFLRWLYQLTRDEVLKSRKPGEFKPIANEIGLTSPRQISHRQIAIRNSRILTMQSHGILESTATRASVIAPGDIVNENDGITAVGPRRQVAIRPGARRLDAAGETIMPGIADVHAHLHSRGGVTTTPDPSIDSNRDFPYSEKVDTDSHTASEHNHPQADNKLARHTRSEELNRKARHVGLGSHREQHEEKLDRFRWSE